MTKKLTWRLSKLPTPDELRELVKDKIVTQEEARDILFSSEEVEKRDEASLKSEIKFLREMIEKLAGDRNKITQIIREVEKPYQKWLWIQPYQNWSDVSWTTTASSQNAVYCDTSGATNFIGFSQIKTF